MSILTKIWGSVICMLFMSMFACTSTYDLVSQNPNDQIINLQNKEISYRLSIDPSSRIFSNHEFVNPVKLVHDGKEGFFIWDMGYGKVFKVLPDTLIPVGNQGVGPGEYAGINDIDYDQLNNELIIHDIELSKFMFFNDNLEYQREVRTSLYLDQFQRFRNGDYGLYGAAENYIDGSLNMHNFVVLDSSLSKIKFSMIDYSDPIDDMELGKHHFLEFSDEIFLIHPLDEKIFILNRNDYSLKKTIQLKLAPKKDLARLKGLKRLEKLFEVVYGENNTFKGLPFNLYRSSNHLLFQFMKSGQRGFGLIDLISEEAKLFLFEGDPKFYPDFVLGNYDDKFIIRAPVEDRYGLFILDPTLSIN